MLYKFFSNKISYNFLWNRIQTNLPKQMNFFKQIHFCVQINFFN